MGLLCTVLWPQIKAYFIGFCCGGGGCSGKEVYKYLDKKTLSAVHFLLYTSVFVYLSFFQIVHFFTVISKVKSLLCPSKCLEKLGSLERIKLENMKILMSIYI